MRAISPSTSSAKRGHVHVSRTIKALLPLAALTVACSVESAFAQIDSTQLVDRGSAGSYLVSRNQLLAPAKALRAAERAQKEFLSGHMDSAQKEITRALDIAPHFGVAKVLQGSVYLDTKNYEGAAKFFQEAIDDDPTLGSAYVLMGATLMSQNRFQAALIPLERAEALLPCAWLVHFVEGSAQLELGNTEAALTQAQLAERVAGTDPKARSAVSYIRALVSLGKKDANSAREYLAETIAREPNGDFAALAKRKLEQLQPLVPSDKIEDLASK